MISQGHVLQSTTQKYLEIYDITNDVLILQDGAVSMVLNSTAINFDLYSEEEQDAAIYAYAALLNSLSFPIEIVIRSQKKDVSSYLDVLKDQEVKAYNPVNKKNIREYRTFVEDLVQERNVLEKKFYIIITFTAIEAGLVSGSSFIPGMNKNKSTVLDKQAILEKAITNLQPRRDHLAHQFARIGLFVRQLTTQDLIQLYYTIYNPESAKGVRLGDGHEYISPLIQADIRPPELVQVPPQLAGAIQPPPPPSTSIVNTPPVVVSAPSATTPSQPAIPQTTAPAQNTVFTQPPNAPSLPQTPASAPKLVLETEEKPTASTPQAVPGSSSQPQPQMSPPMSSQPQSAIKEESFTISTDLTPPQPPAMPQTTGDAK